MLTPSQQIVVLDKRRSLDDRITDLHKDLIKLNTERAKLKSQLAPVWTVPSEILSYIFELVHREEVTHEFPADFLHTGDCPKSDFSIRISHVSVHFRNIAIRTRALWALIHVRDFQTARLGYIATCLERSGTLPVSIFLHCPIIPRRLRRSCRSSSIKGSAVVEAMTLIQANTYRLKRLKVDLESEELMHSVLMHLDRPAPRLTTLELSVGAFNFVPTPSDFALFGNEMNGLTELRMHNIPISWSPYTFQNLVELHIYYYLVGWGWEGFWATISTKAPLLRRIYFYLSLPSLLGSGSDVQEHYVMNSLEELHLIHCVRAECCSQLISQIRAPNLRYLAILRPFGDDDFTETLNKISESPIFPNLTLLQLARVRMDKKSVLQRFRRVYPWLRKREYLCAKKYRTFDLFAAPEDYDSGTSENSDSTGSWDDSGTSQYSDDEEEPEELLA